MLPTGKWSRTALASGGEITQDPIEYGETFLAIVTQIFTTSP
jgi:hypothetical protein